MPRAVPFTVPTVLLITVLFLSGSAAIAQPSGPEAGVRGYLRDPDLHGDLLVFSSSGDIMAADLAGGVATRLTSHFGEERHPVVSPDGRWIAFTGEYYGNDDVFVIPSTGGQPRQLTWHSSSDRVVGFTPGGAVIFEAERVPPYRAPELWTVPVTGGFPEKLSYLRGAEISYEPGGDRVALQPMRAYQVWNQYRGGGAEKIWVGSPGLPEFNLVSHHAGNESHPMWHENGRIYFITDLNEDGVSARENLFSMTPGGSDLRRETSFTEFDARTPSIDGDRIVFLHGLRLAVFDIPSGDVTYPALRVPSDLPTSAKRFVDPNQYVDSWRLNHDGSRLVVDARGDVFTLPSRGDGLIRQWTYRSGSREKQPAFDPGGPGLLLISDTSGEDRIVRLAQPGGDLVDVEDDPRNDWKYRLAISPDGRWAACDAGTQRLYVVDLETGQRRQVAQGGWEFTQYAWSPDGRFLAYVEEVGEAERQALHIYDIRTNRSHALGDDRFNTYAPAWDPDGRYLYCVTDRNFNPYLSFLQASYIFDRTGTLALFRLREETPSPFIARGDEGGKELPTAPWMGENGDKDEDDEQDDAEPKPVIIEFEGLNDRMVAFPEQPGNYSGLEAAGNYLYFLEHQISGAGGQDLRDYEGTALRAFDLAARESSELAAGIDGYDISDDGSTLVVRKNGSWYTGDASGASISLNGESKVDLSGWEIEIQPREEWKQVLHEAWRKQREFFYDPAMHETDWAAVREKFEPWIDRMTTRQDLQDLMREMQAELKVGHAFVGSGDRPHPDSHPVGYLGIDVAAVPDRGCFRITRVLNPEPGTEGGSSPLVHADPLTSEGTCILAVNGRRVDPAANFYQYFQNQAGDEVALLLSDSGDREDAREVVVTTLRSERWLRYLDWANRKQMYVDEQSDGAVGYVYLPDMYENGIREWGRNYFPQKDRPGMILDDRYNSGGNVAETIIKTMTAPIFALQASRYGGVQTKPHGAYNGHVAVLINGSTFSDGETMAYATTQTDDWTLIGTRTYGGWIWLWNRRPAVDNSYTIVPEFGGWGLNGEWIIEGPGVAAEVRVVNDPASEIRGEDPQLDAAIEHLLMRIEEDPRELPEKPTVGPYSR